MSRKYHFICASLLISLFIYLFYRTDKTLVNEIFIKMISYGTYTRLKAQIVNIFPLHNMVIYSLPEGLWIFCITLTSKPYYVRLRNWRIAGIFIPLICCFALEILQFLHVTNGRFDFVDLGFGVVFWILGNCMMSNNFEKQNILTRPNLKTIVCLASYCIVYLAHVYK